MKLLVKCVLISSTCRQVMEMAYAITVEREKPGVLKVPSIWSKNEAAHEDWYYGFMTRFADQLSLRKPEALGWYHALMGSDYVLNR